MASEVSVGNVVEKLMEQYSYYNPSKYLFFLTDKQKEKDSTLISKIKNVDIALSSLLNKLYRNLLLFRKGNVQLEAIHILDFLKNEYAPLIYSLEGDNSKYAQLLFDNWKIEWMVNQLKDAELLLYDEDFAEQHYLPITKEIKNKVKEMREFMFTEEELLMLFGESYFDDTDEDDDYLE